MAENISTQTTTHSEHIHSVATMHHIVGTGDGYVTTDNVIIPETRTYITLGVDFGPVNTGFCVVQKSGGIDHTQKTLCGSELAKQTSDTLGVAKILFWEDISPKSISIPCQECLRNPVTPKRRAKTVVSTKPKSANWKNAAGLPVCKKHGGVTEFRPDLCDRFVYYLDTKILPLGINVTHPEVQVAARNHVLYYIFKMWCMAHPEIIFKPVSSTEKVKWIDNPKPASDFPSGKGRRRSKRHAYLKAEMVKLATKLVPAESREFLVTTKKNDDLAEAYLNAIIP